MNELEILKIECNSLINEIQIQVSSDTTNNPRDIGILQRLINVNQGFEILLADLNQGKLPILVDKCNALATQIEQEKVRVRNLAK